MTKAWLIFWYIYAIVAFVLGGYLLGLHAWVAGPIDITCGLLVLASHTYETREDVKMDGYVEGVSDGLSDGLELAKRLSKAKSE